MRLNYRVVEILFDVQRTGVQIELNKSWMCALNRDSFKVLMDYLMTNFEIIKNSEETLILKGVRNV